MNWRKYINTCIISSLANGRRLGQDINTRCRHTFGIRDMYTCNLIMSVTCLRVIGEFARGPLVRCACKEGNPFLLPDHGNVVCHVADFFLSCNYALLADWRVNCETPFKRPTKLKTSSESTRCFQQIRTFINTSFTNPIFQSFFHEVSENKHRRRIATSVNTWYTENVCL